MKYVTVAGFGWIFPALLVAWWAGFAPFPNSPYELGEHRTAHVKYDRQESSEIVSAVEARTKVKELKYGLNQFDDTPYNDQTQTLYAVREYPFFGWTAPQWVLSATSYSTVQYRVYSETPMALYRTYGACEWNMKRINDRDDAERVSYERWATEQHQKIDNTVGPYLECKRVPK
jgi:hypothetical protein